MLKAYKLKNNSNKLSTIYLHDSSRVGLRPNESRVIGYLNESQVKFYRSYLDFGLILVELSNEEKGSLLEFPDISKEDIREVLNNGSLIKETLNYNWTITSAPKDPDPVDPPVDPDPVDPPEEPPVEPPVEPPKEPPKPKISKELEELLRATDGTYEDIAKKLDTKPKALTIEYLNSVDVEFSEKDSHKNLLNLIKQM